MLVFFVCLVEQRILPLNSRLQINQPLYRSFLFFVSSRTHPVFWLWKKWWWKIRRDCTEGVKKKSWILQQRLMGLSLSSSVFLLVHRLAQLKSQSEGLYHTDNEQHEGRPLKFDWTFNATIINWTSSYLPPVCLHCSDVKLDLFIRSPPPPPPPPPPPRVTQSCFHKLSPDKCDRLPASGLFPTAGYSRDRGLWGLAPLA